MDIKYHHLLSQVELKKKPKVFAENFDKFLREKQNGLNYFGDETLLTTFLYSDWIKSTLKFHCDSKLTQKSIWNFIGELEDISPSTHSKLKYLTRIAQKSNFSKAIAYILMTLRNKNDFEYFAQVQVVMNKFKGKLVDDAL